MIENPKDRVPHVLESPLTIADQGSFYAGGRLLRNEEGKTTYAGHLYASFQKPLRPRKYPLIMWHGGGQTGKSWESTPDGREGYNTIWLRRDFSVFLVDEPYVGRGGKPPVDFAGTSFYDDQRSFQSFREGRWESAENPKPEFFEGSQVEAEDWAFAQRRKQSSSHLLMSGVPRPDSPEGVMVEALPYPEAPDAGAALFDAVGPSILVSHSHGGFLGWSLALRTDNVRGIVCYEPVRFIYPEGERPGDLGIWALAGGENVLQLQEVPLEEFLRLTRMPIQIVYGDYIKTRDGEQKWKDAVRAAEAFVAAVNRHGGDAQILHLPDEGVTGNSHFPFADKNNCQVADLMADWLTRKKLDVWSE